MFIMPFYACIYAYQDFLSLSAPELLFMHIRPFYAYQRPSSFYAYQAFLYLSALEMLRFMLIRVKKNEIDLSRNDLLFGDGLSGWSFGSRQNNKWSLLD
jgi:hypothetical protein